MALLALNLRSDGASMRYCEFNSFPCTLGRHEQADLVLSGWRVAREHARIEQVGSVLRLIDTGSLMGTRVNGQRITEFGPLSPQDEIEIGDHWLQVMHVETTPPVAAGKAQQSFKLEGHPPQPESSATQVRMVQRLHRQLVQALDLRTSSLQHLNPTQLRSVAQQALEAIVEKESEPVDDQVLHAVLDEAVGLGPLQGLLADEAINEIMVNRWDQIWIERQGQLASSPIRFSSEASLRSAVDRMLGPLGRRIDEASPMVDARLPDGSRINAVIPPLAIQGCVLTIRRFNRRYFSADQVLQAGTLSAPILGYLQAMVQARHSIVVSGGTASGKTTMLNLLACSIGAHERVISIEDAAELQLGLEHWVALESRPANTEGQGEVSIRDLVRNALRMRPDRLIVGECRGAEAIDMLQAMNTGHAGSMTTLHANTARDSLARLETMALMANLDLPVQAIREQIASAVAVVVQMQRLSSGKRVVTEVAEVVGIEGPRIQLQPLFHWAPSEERFVASGLPSTYLGCSLQGRA
jgi:pilus assembly protein CpaF